MNPIATSPAQSTAPPDTPPPAPPPDTAPPPPPTPAPPSALSTPALESELVSLAGHLAAAHCRWLVLLAEFDVRDGWGGPGMRSCAHWLSWRVGMSLRTALDQLRVARALPALPAVTTAFSQGRISYSKVRAITRIATPDTEQPLLELALAGTASHVERVVRLTRQTRANPAATAGQRALRWHFDDEGDLRLSARLPAVQGAQLIAALNNLVEPPPPTRRSAERAQSTAQQSTDQRPDPDPTATSHADLLAARRADALLAMATGSRPTDPHLVVHLDVDRREAQIDRGPGLPLNTAEQLACTARVRAQLNDRRGNPLYLGRTRRLVPKTLLAALHFRDNHQCQFPGCTHTRWLHAHHIRHWLHGGATNIDNLVTLCEFHHRLVHDHRFQIRGRGTHLRFIAPNGQTIPVTGPPTEGTSLTLVELSRQYGGPSDNETLTPTWAGERLDPTPILMRLLDEPTPRAA